MSETAESGRGHGGAGQLVQMANDIGHFFRAEPVREDAVAGIADHITKFWTRRMREKLIAHFRQTEQQGHGLEDLPLAALRRLIAQQAAAPLAAPPAGRKSSGEAH